jgi:formylglycine-generating enzyme required for sulfatase activity
MSVAPPVPAPAPAQPPSPAPVRPQRAINNVLFVEIPLGSFVSGSAPGEPGHEPQEQRRLVPMYARYWLSKTEITQEQFERVMGINPSTSRGPQLPVTCVTFDEAQAFCARLSNAEFRVRLPTEDEWEYACRAGSALPFSAPPGEQAQLERALEKYRQGDTDFLLRFVSRQAWVNQGQPRPVGTLRPNAWGLHDMQGNVWEWCAAEPRPGDLAPLRGGGWTSPHILGCRAAVRDLMPRATRRDSIGFRVVAEP